MPCGDCCLLLMHGYVNPGCCFLCARLRAVWDLIIYKSVSFGGKEWPTSIAIFEPSLI